MDKQYHITVIHKCKHYSLVPAGKDEAENSKIEAESKYTYCPSCQERIDEYNKKASKAGRGTI